MPEPGRAIRLRCGRQLIEDGQFTYAWDAENRLARLETSNPSAGTDVKVEFRYGYMGRRVEKKVYQWDPAGGGGAGAWDAAPDVWKRWVYYDWLPIVEFDVVASGGAIGTGDGLLR